MVIFFTRALLVDSKTLFVLINHVHWSLFILTSVDHLKLDVGGFETLSLSRNDYTIGKFAMVYFMAKKSAHEVFQKFKELLAIATKLHGANILKLRFQHFNAVQSLRIDGGAHMGSIHPVTFGPIADQLGSRFLLLRHTHLNTRQKLNALELCCSIL